MSFQRIAKNVSRLLLLLLNRKSRRELGLIFTSYILEVIDHFITFRSRSFPFVRKLSFTSFPDLPTASISKSNPLHIVAPIFYESQLIRHLQVAFSPPSHKELTPLCTNLPARLKLVRPLSKTESSLFFLCQIPSFDLLKSVQDPNSPFPAFSHPKNGISKPTSSITECFLGLEKIITNWRRNEQDEDHKCSQSEIVPVIRSSSILKQAARFYSRKLYSFFEEEFLQGVGGMSIDFVSNDSSKFLVNHTENKDQSNPWVVHFDATDCTIQCTCKKFETMGLLCCHSMRVLRQLDIVKIPEKYLMLRWSAKARKSFYSGYGCLGKGTDSGSGFIFRNHISRFAYQISTRAQGNELAEQYMLGAMKDMAENIDLLVEGKMINSNFIAKSKSRAAPVSAFKDPQKCRPKGISNARLKGYWEKKKQKKRPVMNAKNTTDKGKDISSPDVYFQSMPECFTEEFINRRKTREEGGPYTPYTRMMMDSFTSELEF
ncbi:hypothetical protein M5K25_009298 [Dendrobium thyrsiflorum]|uniref:Protein FAR1-RELATED SEQUENCE n=1 Tax=Dendrobium thyrsiflorum TaxID=117978 RepID=A0ABD0V5X9_DENTH